jgi:hypothetical protein
MRFEDFELDLDLGEIRRVGSLVKLERIPMKLLCLLVVRHGEVLTRPEIIETLWGKDIYKDTDNGINTGPRKHRFQRFLASERSAVKWSRPVPAHGLIDRFGRSLPLFAWSFWSPHLSTSAGGFARPHPRPAASCSPSFPSKT